MAVCQNLVPLVNIKIAGKWMFIPLKMVLIGIDPYPYMFICTPDLHGNLRSEHELRWVLHCRRHLAGRAATRAWSWLSTKKMVILLMEKGGITLFQVSEIL